MGLHETDDPRLDFIGLGSRSLACDRLWMSGAQVESAVFRWMKQLAGRLRNLLRRISPAPAPSTLYHEAGHAVAAIALGIGLKRVSVRRDWVSEGRTELLERWPQHRPGFNPQDPKVRLEAESWIIMGRAGDVSERLCSRGQPGHDPDPGGRWWDFEHSKELSRLLFPDPRKRKAFLKKIRARTHRLVTDPLRWRQITAVTAELARLRELDGEQVARIMGEVARAAETEERDRGSRPTE
jgi:hypothetical protein